MLYYQELTIIDQSEISSYFIWSKLYAQLHLAFVEQKDEQEKIFYGVSFPQYRINEEKGIGFLGSKVRIFAKTELELQQLSLDRWLERLVDYVHITKPRNVPTDKISGYATYFRINPKDSVETRIIHQAKRRNISIEEAKEHFKNFVQKPNHAPYINLRSETETERQNQIIRFRLQIGKIVADEATIGNFGTYGLSRSSTVPEF